MFIGETNMNSLTIPLDVWLGNFNKIDDENFKYNFEATGCFNVKQVDISKKPFLLERNQPLAYIHGTELVIGINAFLNTDVDLWPEGIKEDFSNVIYYKDDEDGKYKFLIFIEGEEIEDGLSIEVENEAKEVEVVSNFAFLVEPKFDVFLNNEKDTFMSLITNSSYTKPLNEGMAAVGAIRKCAPKIRIMKINLETNPDLHYFDTPSEISNLTKVGICRYINKCFPDLIHGDMVEKVKHVNLLTNEKEEASIAISVTLFGFLYFISVDYVTDYNFGEELENDDDFEGV